MKHLNKAVIDPNTLSNYLDVRVVFVHLDLRVDFSKNVLHGHVHLTCTVEADQANELVLDSKTLDVRSVTNLDTNQGLQFTIVNSEEDVPSEFGSALHISLGESPLPKSAKFTLCIQFSTMRQSTALQWLDPPQTLGKSHPYLFSQCQAIHARSFFPCQDTPYVKTPYTARISVPTPLVALMSAIRTGSSISEDGFSVYTFEQKVPIPSYLFAIAIGDLHSKRIGPRSHVWCEKEVLEAAASEFQETEAFIATAESFLVPYYWGVYDILLLPPSFPYGGMENPNLTFVTPTLLAGDRSLVSVVTHEIAHSWSGNLVTNATWQDFWMNEGFTMYIQRRILARMNMNESCEAGELEQEFDAWIGYNALKNSVDQFGATHNFTRLIPDLKGCDPDDAFSSVPYEKGFNFLYYLMRLVGGHALFDLFLQSYFDHFKFESITSDEMKEFFLEYFRGRVPQEKLDSIQWDAWFFNPGLPLVPPQFDTRLSDQSKQLAQKWLDSAQSKHNPTDDIRSWSTKQKVYFLETLDSHTPLPHELLEALDAAYALTSSTNAEVRFNWHMVCLKSHHKKIFPEVVKFVSEQGRMKYVRPLYRALDKATGGHEVARQAFEMHQSKYHSIAAKMLAKDLGMMYCAPASTNSSQDSCC